MQFLPVSWLHVKGVYMQASQFRLFIYFFLKNISLKALQIPTNFPWISSTFE